MIPMTKRITAKQAREIMSINLEEILNDVYQKIRAAAENQESQIALKEGFWCRDTKKWLEVKDILQESGFEVVFYYRKEYPFLDAYTIISW